MKAAFSTRPLTITNKPTLVGFVHVLDPLMDCDRNHSTPGQALGKFHICIPSQLWKIYSQTAYTNRQARPGDRPFYTPNSNSSARASVDNVFALKYKLHHD